MNTEILETVGKIGGVGGIALGIFFLLFRKLIQQSLFQKFSATQASRFITLLSILVWSIAITGLGAWTWVKTNTHTELITTIDVQNGVSSGGSIKNSEIIINRAAPESHVHSSSVIHVQGGVASGGDIENSQIKITTPQDK